MKINFKKLAIYILIPLLLGALVGLLTSPGDFYKTVNMPSFAPPGILFPIVWSILYILMGISAYMVSESDKEKDMALLIYYAQLIVNLLWSFFFTFKFYLFSFIWIILLIALVVWMIAEFYVIKKVSAFIQIPYLLWISFAAILNYAIYTLN